MISTAILLRPSILDSKTENWQDDSRLLLLPCYGMVHPNSSDLVSL
jgi:hypothetical protein